MESSISIDSMPLLISFRAHAEDITDIQLIGKQIVTCSTDCTVRMFTKKGEFIGVFGQQKLWDIYNLNLEAADIPADIMHMEEVPKNILPNLGANLYELAKKNMIGKSEAENFILESWFSKSIYAKERFINRPRKICSKAHTSIYHELTEISTVSLPRII
jgi:hypothetical protein